MVITKEEIKRLRKQLEIRSLQAFFMQLKEIIIIPTGNKSDRIFKEYFNFVKKVEKLIGNKENE